MPKRTAKERTPLTASTEVKRHCYASDGICWVECTLALPRIAGGGRGGERIAAFYAREEAALLRWCERMAADEAAAYEASTDPRKRFTHRCRRYQMLCSTVEEKGLLTVKRSISLTQPTGAPTRAALYECWRLPEGLLLPQGRHAPKGKT